MKKALPILLSTLLLLTATVPVAATSSTIYGDANGDGLVNARDVALLQQAVAGWDVTMEESADATGDGLVNARDVALVQQFVAGWDVNLEKVIGDATGDGLVNARDVALLQQAVAGWDATLAASADANGDGLVNARDVALLQQFVAGWDVTLGAVPVELPENGYDLGGRGRVFAENITLNGNTVTVEIVNRAKNWITEETSYVKYICTDADGNVLTLPDRYYGYLYFGMLEVGESHVMTFTLPEGTAKVEFGACYIVYWTPWS